MSMIMINPALRRMIKASDKGKANDNAYDKANDDASDKASVKDVAVTRLILG